MRIFILVNLGFYYDVQSLEKKAFISSKLKTKLVLHGILHSLLNASLTMGVLTGVVTGVLCGGTDGRKYEALSGVTRCYLQTLKCSTK